MTIPEAAPDPASPTKWILPMLLANREAPTYKERQTIDIHVSVH